jgi:serine/threonine protein kinase
VCSLGFVLTTETEQGIFEQVLNGKLDFDSEPWPNISESAKDLVRRILVRNPKKRLTAHEVLCEFLFHLFTLFDQSIFVDSDHRLSN